MIIKVQDTSQKQMYINDITFKLQELGHTRSAITHSLVISRGVPINSSRTR